MRRRSVRLRGHDYSRPGSYYVTLCTANRQCLFGDVIHGTVELNALGRIVEEEWRKTATIRPDVELDEFMVMPNHVHGILVIRRGERQNCGSRVARFGRSVAGSVAVIVGQFKSVVTKTINRERGTPGANVWQRNYYDRVIRNDQELNRIREYIRNNPNQWAEDRENTQIP
jgi:REP element-mobilizing transposase RayT